MSVFVRKDPRQLACRDPSLAGALFAMLRRHTAAAGVVLLVAAISYLANVALGLRAAAQVRGSISGLPVFADVRIDRDARGIPHIRARNTHDLFFAQGFAEASDRLFEMEVTRRYAYGTLAEVFGAKALDIDANMRSADIADIAEREWQGSDAQTRRVLQAFADGVNAAQAREPVPVEFRMLLYRPKLWTPQDSLAVSLVAALELGDAWRDVIDRDNRWRALSRQCFDLHYPLSDPRYDVTLDGRMLPARRDAIVGDCAREISLRHFQDGKTRPRLGSNAWAAGALRTREHRALIANDPHVDLTIPGIWYAVDLRAPGFHAAGAVVPGLPGVVLGHNERVAWAVTNAEVATSVLYRTTAPPQAARVVETFHVRFGAPVTRTYYRTRDAFSINTQDEDGGVYFVRWPPYRQRTSTIPTLLALDRASNVHAALKALSVYQGAPQNFIVGDTAGAVAYHLAGAMYDDPSWGRYVHPGRDLAQSLHLLAFADLPARAPSRSGVLLTANNRIYGPGYHYRLSAAFEPPYRAYRIAQLLRARSRYDAAYFARMQMDACSPIDAEIAREVGEITSNATLARWNGCFTPSSQTASTVHQLRDALAAQSGSLTMLIAALRHPLFNQRDGIDENAAAAVHWLQGKAQPWARTGQVAVEHPLSPAWYGLLRGHALPGQGDEYTIHLQEPGFAQGFRAVWDVGNWDAGGIVLPSGESGEPGSGHYDDLAKTWVHGAITPLPFTNAAIAKATVDRLILER